MYWSFTYHKTGKDVNVMNEGEGGVLENASTIYFEQLIFWNNFGDRKHATKIWAIKIEPQNSPNKNLLHWLGGVQVKQPFHVSCSCKNIFFVKIGFRQMTNEVCDQICQGCKTQECPQEVLQKCGCANGMIIYL